MSDPLQWLTIIIGVARYGDCNKRGLSTIIPALVLFERVASSEYVKTDGALPAFINGSAPGNKQRKYYPEIEITQVLFTVITPLTVLPDNTAVLF